MKGPILAHTQRKAPESRSNGDLRLVRKITAHVERHLGRIKSVFHDLLSDVVQIDLLWVEAGPDRNFHTFVTCGMSERPMTVPGIQCECRYAELLLRLPTSWPLDPASLMTEEGIWPLRELEHLARTPHLYETRVWGGHSVGNADEDGTLQPLCSATRFHGSILGDPGWTPPEFRRLRVDRQRTVRFFSAIPIYREELVLARDYGSDLLFEHLEHAGVTDFLDSNRPNLLATQN